MVWLCCSVHVAPCANRFQCTGAQSSPQWDMSYKRVEGEGCWPGGFSHHWALNTQTGSLVSSDILGRESVWKSVCWKMWSYMLMCSPLGWFGRPAWFSAVLPITTYGTRHFWGGWAYKCCCVRSIPSNRLIQLRNYWRKKKPGDSGHNGNVGGQLQVILVLAELQSVQSPKMGRTEESSVIVFYLFTSW